MMLHILILDSSDGFNDEGGKIDVEVGSSTDEFDNILAEDREMFLHLKMVS